MEENGTLSFPDDLFKKKPNNTLKNSVYTRDLRSESHQHLVQSIHGKEKEIVEEFEHADLEILAITETKKKSVGITELENGHVLVFSGVHKEKRAAAGVGCIIHKKMVQQINNWKAWSERILEVRLKDEGSHQKTVIVVYGPNEDDRAECKDQFWEKLTKVTEEAKGEIYIAGDFNSRVGKGDHIYRTIVGEQGENVRNNNGIRLLDFCLMHNLVITNTYFKHKDIHKYTREERSRGEKSIIDYILVQRSNMRRIVDVKVQRGPEIYSDHYLLAEKNIAEKFEGAIEQRIEKDIEILNGNIEEIWNKFKDIVIETAKQECGTCKKDNRKKQTVWWTEKIKEHERKRVKDLVLESKKKAWEEFGNKMEENSKNNQKLFYTVLKSLRSTETYSTLHVKSKNGDTLTDEKDIMARWREYFEELLKASENMETNVQSELRVLEENEEVITLEELKETIKDLKNGKAPGEDKITRNGKSPRRGEAHLPTICFCGNCSGIALIGLKTGAPLCTMLDMSLLKREVTDGLSVLANIKAVPRILQ
ncbi:uncharacterized protein LOC111691409 [Anoplophora glabripennis]|uniref:uncharacterized protein LOC111691409 n=1 Tax=Anoplophora glabripennis TaxID=217634 RepID=UPI000C77CC8B|nr:uncharacterized protein LOC111691409 [Anoplophora glabripennis]